MPIPTVAIAVYSTDTPAWIARESVLLAVFHTFHMSEAAEIHARFFHAHACLCVHRHVHIQVYTHDDCIKLLACVYLLSWTITMLLVISRHAHTLYMHIYIHSYVYVCMAYIYIYMYA